MVCLCYHLLGYKRPTNRDINRYVVPNYTYRWQDIGVNLQFNYATLQTICADCLNKSEKCCKDLFVRWLQSTANATWDLLFKALDNLPDHCKGEV